ncbi:MAG: polysaccharide deacetylase family protein [Candidatus Cloacimonadaceae bacterium]|jgi:hypothetical protein|nr:polysaccharide deacetylase family protein [Candidatus Cloacimonadota bacterium]MDX9950047.1 polysaccharide deacetylase family protein [Candidatus Syntrophosphaera sp.]
MRNKIHISVDFDWIPGSERSVARLFKIFACYDLHPTLFFTGSFAAANPGIILKAADLGYEIGTHGLHHGLDVEENFGPETPYKKQKKLLGKATDILGDITGRTPRIFRAPLLKISEATFDVLGELGYQADSSIPARRYDFGAGSVNALRCFCKPSKAHFIETKNGRLLEIPPSAWILPLNMRLLRIFPHLFVRVFFNLLAHTCQPLVFYLHPAEFVNPQNLSLPQGFPKGFYRDCGEHHFGSLERFLELIKCHDLLSAYMLEDIKLV